MKYCLILFSIVNSLFTNAQLSKEQWREDIQYMVKKVHEIHPNPYYKYSRATLDKAEDRLLNNINNWEPEKIIANISRYLAMIQDGHTQLIPVLRGESKLELHYLPFFFKVFDDGVYIRVTTDSAYSYLIGARLLQLGKIPVKKILETLKDYASGDNDYSKKIQIPMGLSCIEILKGSGLLTGNKPELKFQTRDNRVITIEPTIVNTPPFRHDIRERISSSAPLYKQNQDKAYSINYLPGEKLLYLNYRQIASDPSLPVRKLGDTINYLSEKEDVQKSLWISG